MEAAVRAKTTTLEGISFAKEDGHVFGTMEATGDPDQQSLVSEFEIFRGDLSKILYDLTKHSDHIKYIFGEQVASMQQAEDGDGPVRVEFKNGTPTAEYDLVVACDGATSRTRAMGLSCDVRDYVSHSGCWSAFFSITQDLLNGSKVGQGYSAVGGRFIAIGPDPAGVTRVTLMNYVPKKDAQAMQSFRDALKQGDNAMKQYLSQHYKGIGWKTEEALRGMMETDDFYASETVQVKPPILYKGRFVLVGDAGYVPGLTGSGTTLALAGAYVLAGEVNSHKGNLAAALAGCEQQMRPIIRDLQNEPPFVGTIMAPQTAWGLWLRNNFITFVSKIAGFVAWTGILQFAQSHFAGAFAGSEKYPLKEYEWVR